MVTALRLLLPVAAALAFVLLPSQTEPASAECVVPPYADSSGYARDPITGNRLTNPDNNEYMWMPDPPRVTFSPSTITVPEGEEATVKLNLAGHFNLCAPRHGGTYRTGRGSNYPRSGTAGTPGTGTSGWTLLQVLAPFDPDHQSGGRQPTYIFGVTKIQYYNADGTLRTPATVFNPPRQSSGFFRFYNSDLAHGVDVTFKALDDNITYNRRASIKVRSTLRKGFQGFMGEVVNTDIEVVDVEIDVDPSTNADTGPPGEGEWRTHEETCRFNLSGTGCFDVDEGYSKDYRLRLREQPGAGETMTVTPFQAEMSGGADLTFSPVSVSFTSADGDWDEWKTVTVTAPHDDDARGADFKIEHRFSGNFHHNDPTTRSFTQFYGRVIDDDRVEMIVKDSHGRVVGDGLLSSHLTLFAGTETYFTVELSHKPHDIHTVRAFAKDLNGGLRPPIGLRHPSHPQFRPDTSGYPSASLNYGATSVQFTPWNWDTPKRINIRRWSGAVNPQCLTLPADATAVDACWKIDLALVGNGLKQSQTLYLGMPEPDDQLFARLDWDKVTVVEGETVRLWATLSAPNPTDGDLTVGFSRIPGRSTSGIEDFDFNWVWLRIFIAPGESRGFLAFTAHKDSEPDNGETLVVQPVRNDTSNLVRIDSSQHAKITVVDPPSDTARQVLAAVPSLTIASDVQSVSEGGDVVFTISADPAPQLDTTVNLFVSQEMGDGLDYVGQGDAVQVTIPAGQGSVDWTLTTYSDNTQLTDGTIVGRINSGDGYTLGDPHSVSLDLLDDDAPSGYTVDPGVVAQVQALASQTQHGADHVNRWQRVLEAFGVEDYPSLEPMTAAQAQRMADKYSSPVWDLVVTELTALEAAPTPTPTPEVSVTADDDAPPPGPVLVAQLEADVRSYAAETHHGALHVNRWQRVLEAFGLEDYPGLEPTTLDEARVHVDIGRSRWIPVLAHMVALDAVNPQPTPTQASGQVDAQVLATARSKAGETHRGVKHVNRWKRVLEAFGDGDYPGIEPLTAAGAQVYANVWSAWTEVAAQLRLIEAAATTNLPPVIPPVIPPVVVPPTTEVNITAAGGGTEGQTVTFTLTASPAPAADLDVDISVVTSGDFGYGPIPATVTIPTGGTVTVSITTTDDTTDEPDGTVTLTLTAGSGYTVGANASESADVTDDDNPPPVVAPVAIPDPVVGITAGSDVTEGGNARFTLTASPAPQAGLPVTVTVSQDGDYGAVTGTRTVTVPTSGIVSFTVATSDDSTDEPDGSVTATVNTGAGYTVSTSHGAGTVGVSDNDDPPTPEVSITAAGGGTEGQTARFTLTASPAPQAGLPVTVTVSQDGDYGAVTGTRTVTVPTSGIVSFTVATSDDSTDEPDGSVTATVNTGSGYTVSASHGAGTVSVSDNDDLPPASSVTVSVGDASGAEYDWAVDFQVTLSEASSQEVRVRFTTWNWRGLTGRAHMWLDYQLTERVVVFAPGQTERTVTVYLIDDSRAESDEYFTVTLTNPRGATIGQGTATGTIIDDD